LDLVDEESGAIARTIDNEVIKASAIIESKDSVPGVFQVVIGESPFVRIRLWNRLPLNASIKMRGLEPGRVNNKVIELF
jgi:hypothetical protein